MREAVTLSRNFSPKKSVLAGFSLYVINLVGRSSEAAMGRLVEGAQRPVLHVNEPKKTGAFHYTLLFIFPISAHDTMSFIFHISSHY
jgi:hypothetical protein